MFLQHLHLPGLTRYRVVSRLQETLVRRKITHFTASSTGVAGASTSREGWPLLITFAAPPTYTSGRRQHLDAAAVRTLTHPPGVSTTGAGADAAFVPAPRGGLLTFHGPGQLTAYPILQLRAHGLGVRAWVVMLESAIAQTLATYGVKGMTRAEYPGVWVGEGGRRKLASIGVHVQRGVAGYGTGVNVTTAPQWWARFAACGIEGVEMVSLKDEGVEGLEGEEGIRQVGDVLAACLAERLEGVEGVEKVNAAEVDHMLKVAEEQAEADDVVSGRHE